MILVISMLSFAIGVFVSIGAYFMYYDMINTAALVQIGIVFLLWFIFAYRVNKHLELTVKDKKGKNQ